MNTHRVFACLGALLGISLLLAPGTGVCSVTLEQRFNALLEIEDSSSGRLSTKELAGHIATQFDRDFGHLSRKDIKELELSELKALFRAAELAQFHAQRQPDLKAMEAALSELHARGEASDADLQGMFGAYLSMRALDQASRFALAHDLHGQEDIPKVANELPPGFEGPSLLQPSHRGDGLARIPFEPGADAYVVAVSHPMCRYTRMAIAAIEADAELTNLFRGTTHWIAPVDRRFHLDALRNWNAGHPLTQFSIAWDRDDWPAIDYWGTPTFYFFKRGELVAKVSGWPDEGRREELKEAARRAGLD